MNMYWYSIIEACTENVEEAPLTLSAVLHVTPADGNVVDVKGNSL
jgi:hypothetical protein